MTHAVMVLEVLLRCHAGRFSMNIAASYKKESVAVGRHLQTENEEHMLDDERRAYQCFGKKLQFRS